VSPAREAIHWYLPGSVRSPRGHPARYARMLRRWSQNGVRGARKLAPPGAQAGTAELMLVASLPCAPGTRSPPNAKAQLRAICPPSGSPLKRVSTRPGAQPNDSTFAPVSCSDSLGSAGIEATREATRARIGQLIPLRSGAGLPRGRFPREERRAAPRPEECVAIRGPRRTWAGAMSPQNQSGPARRAHRPP
jgi:hypothetical protein